MVGKVGFEPTRLTAKVFETSLSTYSNIHPYNGAGERIRTPKLMIQVIRLFRSATPA